MISSRYTLHVQKILLSTLHEHMHACETARVRSFHARTENAVQTVCTLASTQLATRCSPMSMFSGQLVLKLLFKFQFCSKSFSFLKFPLRQSVWLWVCPRKYLGQTVACLGILWWSMRIYEVHLNLYLVVEKFGANYRNNEFVVAFEGTHHKEQHALATGEQVPTLSATTSAGTKTVTSFFQSTSVRSCDSWHAGVITKHVVNSVARSMRTLLIVRGSAWHAVSYLPSYFEVLTLWLLIFHDHQQPLEISLYRYIDR